MKKIVELYTRLLGDSSLFILDDLKYPNMKFIINLIKEVVEVTDFGKDVYKIYQEEEKALSILLNASNL